MAENKQPDFVIDNDRYCVRVFFGERNEEERMEVIKKASEEFFRRIRPELIRQGKLDKYSIPVSKAT